MTEEEIKQRVNGILDGVYIRAGLTLEEYELLWQQVSQAIREAAVQAYEEAAKVVDDWDTSCDGETAARMIRALKDSLTVEETSHRRDEREQSRRNAK